MHLYEINGRGKYGHDHGQEERLKIKNVGKIVSYINENCSEFIESVNSTGKFLFRGVKHPGNLSMFVGFPRGDRHPVGGIGEDSVWQKTADMCNAYLKVAGFTALRSNSIFCNSEFNEAAKWGTPFAIFPFNGFSFGYSMDITGQSALGYNYPIYDEQEGIYKNSKEYPYKTIFKQQITPQAAEKFIAMNKLTNKNLAYAMENEKDVWIHGKYLAVRQNWILKLVEPFGIINVPELKYSIDYARKL